MITFDDFMKMDMRVGKIIEARKVEGSDKLILIKVDVGEVKQLVAGIADWYEPEELVGRNIIVLVNMQPKRIRGLESNGMLLAADAGKDVALLTVDKDVPSGTRVR